MRKIIAVVMIGVMALTLGGCKGKDFDAKAYVTAAMDAKFQRKYQAYADVIGVSENEAKEQMESEFDTSLKESMSEAGIPITEEEMAEYLKLEAEIRTKVRYKVKSVKKDQEGNYTVQVAVTPVQAYSNLETMFQEKLTAAIQSGVTEDGYMATFLDAMRTCVSEAKMGEEVTVNLHVNGKEGDKQTVYQIEEADWLKLDQIATGGTVSV